MPRSGVARWMNDGVLSGREIELQVRQGEIVIDPFTSNQINPASYDLTLGNEVRIYSEVASLDLLDKLNLRYLDSKRDNPTESYSIGPEGWLLRPGIGYLMHTSERVGTKKFVPVLDGKSSIGRLFIQIHATAGYGDPNFFGQYTLEVIAQHPVVVYAGMRIAQIRFHTIVGEPELYCGNYTGDSAKGAIPSRSWRQFDK